MQTAGRLNLDEYWQSPGPGRYRDARMNKAQAQITQDPAAAPPKTPIEGRRDAKGVVIAVEPISLALRSRSSS